MHEYMLVYVQIFPDPIQKKSLSGNLARKRETEGEVERDVLFLFQALIYCLIYLHYVIY